MGLKIFCSRAWKWIRSEVLKFRVKILKEIRKSPFLCRFLGIPHKRISVEDTGMFLRDDPDTINYQFSGIKKINVHPPTFINSNHKEQVYIHECENFILHLKNAKYFHIHPSVVTASGKQLAIVSNHPEATENEHALFKKLILPLRRKLKGQTLLLSTPNDHNYYHCLFQIAPKVWTVEEHGYQLENIKYFLIEMSNFRFQAEILSELGIEKKKILDLNDHKCIQSSELLLTSPYWRPEPWICERIKNTFLKSEPENNNTNRRIYISRNKAAYRKLINEQELRNALRAYHFDSIEIEGLTIQQQATIFNSCEMIITPHGAALSNTVFCRPGTIVIELRARSHDYDLGKVFEYISSICHLSHFTCLCDESPSYFDSRTKFSDLIVDIPSVIKVLNSTKFNN